MQKFVESTELISYEWNGYSNEFRVFFCILDQVFCGGKNSKISISS